MNEAIFYFFNNLVQKNIYFDISIVFFAQYFIFILILFYIACCISECPNIKPNFKCLKSILIVFTSAFIVWIISQVINHFYFSPRPFLVLDDVKLLFSHGANDSLPSGHTTFIFTLAFASYYCCKRWISNTILVGAIIIALSRVIAGVHWPSDIIGGIILAWLGAWIIKKLLIKYNLH